MKKSISEISKSALGIFILLIIPLALLAQVNPDKSLEERITENRTLFRTSPEKALYNISHSNGLLSEAIRNKDHMSELKLRSDLFEFYYFLRMDFNEMMQIASELHEKARIHESKLYEAKAHKYLAQCYFFNELYDKCADELRKASRVLEKAGQDDLIIMERANIHTVWVNYYMKFGDTKEAINQLYAAVKLHNMLNDPDKRRGTKFMDYSNLGAVYMNIDLDSALYYSKLSIGLALEKEQSHNLMLVNYLVLGSVHHKREEYGKALTYYQKAEEIKENKHFKNVEELYEKFIAVYEALGDGVQKKVYEDKLKDLRIEIAENKNKSLKTLIQEREAAQEAWWKRWFLPVILGFVLAAGILTAWYVRYMRSVDEPARNVELLSPEEYEQFVELAKRNDTTFFLAFEEKFPDFSQKLLKLNPDLTNNEIELLAMLKLNFTSKEIAGFKFVQPKTIQNRRYKVRTTLNLSSSTNLYKWVEGI